MKVRTGIQT